LTGLIKDGVAVMPFKDRLLDRNFGFVHLPKDLRKEKLEKVV